MLLFNNIFVQLFWSSFGSFLFWFFLVKVICYLLDSNWFKNETFLTLEANSEAYSEHCQTSKLEGFAQIVNNKILSSPLERLRRKNPIFDIWHGFEFAFVATIFTKLLAICLLNLISITEFRTIKSMTVFSTYLLNNKNYNSVSWSCVSIDYDCTH